MDTYELTRQVALILSQVRSRPHFTVVPGKAANCLYFDGEPSAPPVALPGTFELLHEQFHLLRRLYTSLPPDLQSLMPTIAMGQVATAPRVVTHALIDWRSTGSLMYVDQTNLETVCEVAQAVADSLTHRAEFFNESELSNIGIFADIQLRKGTELAHAMVDAPPLGRMPHVDAEVGQRLATLSVRIQTILRRIAYLRFRAELLESGNAEINEDQKVLEGRLERLGLGTDLQNALHEIDRCVRSATVPSDFKASMDLCRSFVEKFFERGAGLVATRRDKTIPGSMTRSPFQGWRQYLKNEGLTTEHEDEVFEKLYAFISHAGVHALGSASEQVRVTKNTMIEWTLLVAGRLEAL